MDIILNGNRMREQELKNKIVSAISQYKLKCNQLEDEISVLKSAIYRLSLLPGGIYVGLNKQMHDLQTNIKENKDSKKIKKSVDLLVNAMSTLQEEKQNTQTSITNFVKQGTDLLSHVVITDKDKKIFEEMVQSIKKEKDEEALLDKFNELLEASICWITKQLSDYQQHSFVSLPQASLEQVIDVQINSRLNQLLEQLLIPDDLSNKLRSLKSNLQQQLSAKSLIKVVDNLTDLVIEAFNLEHNQFKGFLDKFTDYLHDIGNYLDSSNHHNETVQQEAEFFEMELQANIKFIKKQIDEAKTIKELSPNLKKSLDLIIQQFKIYKENEQRRIKDYDKKISLLQNRLVEAECGTERIRTQLSFHKVRVNQDPLTGLPNSLAYEEYMQNAFNRWQRGFGEISLAIGDLDSFKAVNENYGYTTGDKILQKIATIFKSSIRAVDFVACLSGQKFAFLFEKTPPHNGVKVLENLKIALEESEFYIRGTKLKITMSFGLTGFEHGDTIETVLSRAETALSKAKAGGKNQVFKL